jgi:hypothetical protein
LREQNVAEDAIRSELRSGRPTGGRFHFDKGAGSMNGLNNLLENGAIADAGDTHAAQTMLQDLIGAMSGE